MLMSRRSFVEHAAVATGLTALASCIVPSAVPSDPGSALLMSHPILPTSSIQPGTWPLNLATGRDGLLLVPSSYTPSVASPLLLALHGAGIDGSGPIGFLGPYAQDKGFILLAPDSRDVTWDGIRGQFGPDVSYIDKALARVFDCCLVDPSRIYIEGFSDGASYGLGLGLANGTLFKRMVAFSPGFVAKSASPPQGKPEIFVSHGREDPVLSFTNTRDAIVPSLLSAGYAVTFVDYEGVHSVTPAVAQAAMDWLIRP
jgi:phospholipase/carboxylesterase